MFNRLFRPFVTSGRPVRQAMPGPLQDLVDAYAPIRHDPLPRNSGYVLITSRENEDEAYLGRNLEFDSNRGLFGRGQPERVILDGHVIYETQLRNTSKSKLKSHFMDLYRIKRVSHAQVADIIAEDDDVEMYGQTEKMNQAFDREFDELRAEMEAEYAERFEEDFRNRRAFPIFALPHWLDQNQGVLTKKSSASKTQYNRLKAIFENAQTDLPVLLHKLLKAHDAVRKELGLEVVYGFVPLNEYGIDKMITKMQVDENIDLSYLEVEQIVKAVDSHDNISKEYGISKEQVYLIKANFR
jgi:hypothetical protein